MSLLFDQRRSIWEKAVWRMPTLSDAELGTGYAGLYTDTPDNHPIIDKVEGIEGLYIAAGVVSSAALPLIPLILRRAQHERPHASHGFPCPGHRNDGREGMDSGSEVGNDGGEGGWSTLSNRRGSSDSQPSPLSPDNNLE